MTRGNPTYLWLWLLLIIGGTLLVRLPYLAGIGHAYDLGLLVSWGESAAHQGLFGVYYNVPSANYPPVYVTMLGASAMLWRNTEFIFPLLKLFPVLCETLLIVAVALWLSPQSHLGWLIPLFLIINPGLIATTALWGQAEAVMTLFLVVALIALNRDKPRIAWVWYALAILTKFQSIVLLPLLLILTFRRYGWRDVLIGALLFGVIMLVLLVPFINGSGWDAAMRHYLTAFDPQPTTVNAFNIWYWITPPASGDLWSIPVGAVIDNQPLAQTLSYRYIGLGLVSLYTLLICGVMWVRYKQKREFLWAAALYVGFFMLATRMHERYLYPAVIFSIVGIAQDRRLWFAAFGVSFVYLFNIIYTLDEHLVWMGLPLLRLLPGTLLNGVILLGITLLAEFARLLFGKSRVRMVNAGARAFAIIIFAAMVLLVVNPPRASLPADAVPLKVDFGDGISLEGYREQPGVITLFWRVTGEIPEGEYNVLIFTERGNNLSLQVDETLEFTNLPLHLSWYGRQLVNSYYLPFADAPLYAAVYSPDRVWNSETLLIR